MRHLRIKRPRQSYGSSLGYRTELRRIAPNQAESRRTAPKRAESPRIPPNRAELRRIARRIAPNRAKSRRIVQNPTESRRIASNPCLSSSDSKRFVFGFIAFSSDLTLSIRFVFGSAGGNFGYKHKPYIIGVAPPPPNTYYGEMALQP